MLNLLSLGGIEVEIMRPEPDLPLDEPHSFVGPFPSAASVITVDAAARLGWKCAVVGIIGDDKFGDLVYNRLVRDGVNVSGIKRDPESTTGVAFVSYTSEGSRSYIFHIDPKTDNISKKQFKFKEWGEIKWLHVNGSSLVSSKPIREACNYASNNILANGGKFSFDPNIRVELADLEFSREVLRPYIKKTDILFPGEEEITSLFEGDLYESIEKALSMGPDLIVVKRGARGCMVATKNDIIKVKGFQVNCVDPTGAGDTFNAAFLFAYNKGLSAEEAAIFANATAALSIKKLGPMEGCPTLKEVINFLNIQEYGEICNKLQ